MKKIVILVVGIGMIGTLLFIFLNQSLICNAPYISAGDACCLDANNNRICDEDEPTSTTIQPTTTTTTSTTSTTTTALTTTSTIAIKPECYQNSDCGAEGIKIIKNYSCYDNSIGRQYIEYKCVNAGTPSARCVGTEKWKLIKSCGREERCIEGEDVCEPKF